MTTDIIIILICLISASAAAFLIFRSRERRKSRKLLDMAMGKKGDSAGEIKTKKKRKRPSFQNEKVENLIRLFDNALYGAGLSIDAETFTLIWIAAVIVVPSIFKIAGIPAFVCIGISMVFTIAPFYLIRFFRKKRSERFEEQLVDAIAVMSSAIRAGFSFQSSLQAVAESSDEPAKSEFNTLFNEIRLGAKIEDALKNLSDRIPSKDVEIFCTALIVQSTIGGNILLVLSNISQTIRARLKIKKDIKAKTASGKMSGYIVGALPIILFIYLYIVNPSYVTPFISTSTGKIVLAIGAVMIFIGFVVIHKIVDIKY